MKIYQLTLGIFLHFWILVVTKRVKNMFQKIFFSIDDGEDEEVNELVPKYLFSHNLTRIIQGLLLKTHEG